VAAPGAGPFPANWDVLFVGAARTEHAAQYMTTQAIFHLH